MFFLPDGGTAPLRPSPKTTDVTPLLVGDAAVVAVVGTAVGEVLARASQQDVVDAHLELGLAAGHARQDGQRRLAEREALERR